MTIRITLAVLLGLGTYVATVFLLDAVIDWLGPEHQLRAVLGSWWAAAQPLALGVFFFLAEVVLWYILLGLVGRFSEKGTHAA